MLVLAVGRRRGKDVSPVRSLLHGNLPAAIFRRVRSVVVDPSERVISPRSRSHVFEECGKAGDPTIADRYSSAAPVFVSRVSNVQATLLHASPGAILRRCGSSVHVGPFCGFFRTETSAGIRESAPEAGSRDHLSGTAGAEAQPLRLPRGAIRTTLKNEERAEGGTSQVNDSGHNRSIPESSTASTWSTDQEE